MAGQGIFVKGVSEDLYREIKAQSARLGKTVSEVVTAAMQDWLRRKAPEEEKEFLQNNLAYESDEERILTDHRGKWIAIERGRIVAAADSIDGLKKSLGDVDHRIILKTGIGRPRKKYIGGSSLRRAESNIKGPAVLTAIKSASPRAPSPTLRRTRLALPKWSKSEG